MSMWRIIPAVPAHIAPIAADMREADRREVWASHRHEPEQALAASLERSDLAWTCLVDDVPAFMWGAARQGSLITLTGSPWLLATPRIDKVRRDFLRRSRNYVDIMQARFPRLENYAHAGNRLSLRWLKWCGFRVADVPTILNGEPFYLFWFQSTRPWGHDKKSPAEAGQRSSTLLGLSRQPDAVEKEASHENPGKNPERRAAHCSLLVR